MADNLKGLTFAELNAQFKTDMEAFKTQTQKISAARGKEGRIAAHQARLAGPETWRRMSGVKLMMHEMKHVGNKPFAWGFATMALVSVYAQAKFTDDMKAGSEYWSTYHGDGKKGGH
mmetsp:Transcript_23618/g.32986  ORF Transcript_23618/g.32986 Transcript_23618/m.32986 type:complete len:117 (-) Transcript_23618:292-642(-)